MFGGGGTGSIRVNTGPGDYASTQGELGEMSADIDSDADFERMRHSMARNIPQGADSWTDIEGQYRSRIPIT